MSLYYYYYYYQYDQARLVLLLLGLCTFVFVYCAFHSRAQHPILIELDAWTQRRVECVCVCVWVGVSFECPKSRPKADLSILPNMHVPPRTHAQNSNGRRQVRMVVVCVNARMLETGAHVLVGSVPFGWPSHRANGPERALAGMRHTHIICSAPVATGPRRGTRPSPTTRPQAGMTGGIYSVHAGPPDAPHPFPC
jgi:hypothetical protein